MTSAVHILHQLNTDNSSNQKSFDRCELDACRRRDPLALERFVLKHQNLVFSYLSRTLGRGPHVEDLAQEVFLKAYNALPRFDPNGPAEVSTWLLTIASRVAIDAKRRHQLPPTCESDNHVSHSAPSPETESHRRELGLALEQAAMQLPSDQRDVLVLAEAHDLSIADIAKVLDVPASTVKTRLFRARERMKALLGSLWEE